MADIFIPGIPVFLQVPEKSPNAFPSVLLGNKKLHFLILEHPSDGGRQIPINSNDPCRLRIVDPSGRIYEFDVKVMAVAQAPEPVVFLTYPQSFSSPTPRLTDRHPVDIRTVFAFERLDGNLDGRPAAMMINISKGGCLLETETPLLPDQILFLTFSFPGQVQIHDDLVVDFADNAVVRDLPAAIRHCQTQGNRYSLGLEFVDMSNPFYYEVRNFVECLDSFRGEA